MAFELNDFDAWYDIVKGVEDKEPILAPWLLRGDVLMLWASRGVGKTRTSLKLAHSLATGQPFMRWKPSRPYAVAYFDGEMGKDPLTRILAATDSAAEVGLQKDQLIACPYDKFPNSIMPDISQPIGQAMYDKASEGAEIIIIDNLLTCARMAGRNDSEVESWNRIQDWALRKREQGITVMFVHHAGKSGDQLGTSTKEVMLDTVVALKYSGLNRDPSVTQFEWHFTKKRNFTGEDAEPMQVEYRKDERGKDIWTHSPLMEAKSIRYLDLKEKFDKTTACDIMGITKGEAGRLEEKYATEVNTGSGSEEVYQGVLEDLDDPLF